MAQFNWTYLSDQGQRYNVGIFHGPRTGHVLIYCNLKVLLIDFSVLDSKDYTFFLGEDLCIVKLERRGDKFYYDLSIDHTTDTPRNRQRKALAKKHWKQSIAFFSAMALCVISFTSLMIYNHQPEEQNQLQYHAGLFPNIKSQQVTGVVTQVTSDKIYYDFEVNKKVYSGSMDLSESPHYNLMPIEIGDEFAISYALAAPNQNSLHLDAPTKKQIQTYFLRAYEKHQEIHPEFSTSKVNCMIEIGYQLKGLEALADFYFQDLSPEKNTVHNNLSYKRLVRDVPFKNMMAERCW